MMKLSRILARRQRLSDILLSRKADMKDNLWAGHGCQYWAGISTMTDKYAAKGYTADRIRAPYTVYKGKAALSIFPVLPTFTKLDSGSLVVERRGVMMMTFWPAVGERKYDWEKRKVFALSTTEVGSLISLGTKDSCEFFHDPAMLSSNAGQVRKSLSIKNHADGSGYFISLTVVDNNLKTRENFNVPVTAAEFSVMRTACSFALPHIMGWDRLTGLPKGMTQQPSKVDPQLLDLEWDK